MPVGVRKMTGNLKTPDTGQRFEQGNYRERRSGKLDVCLSVHRFICVEKKTQLDVTVGFVALMLCLTCFGHFYAHHQEL